MVEESSGGNLAGRLRHSDLPTVSFCATALLAVVVKAALAMPIPEFSTKEDQVTMSKYRSFKISDFSLRDVPWAIAAYLAISLLSIGLGVLLESLPKFWSGFFLGGGSGLLAAFFLLRPARKEVDVASLPEPSATVRAKCDDPGGSFVQAVKAYREETGLGLTEATAVLREYRASKQHPDRIVS